MGVAAGRATGVPDYVLGSSCRLCLASDRARVVPGYLSQSGVPDLDGDKPPIRSAVEPRHLFGLHGSPIAGFCRMEQECLSRNELDRFKSILTARVGELEQVLRSREVLSVEQSSDNVDEVQKASDRALAISNLDRESLQLREARDAISRLRLGSFGVCEECGERIHRRRLLAVPWTAFCIRCREELDRQRRPLEGAGWTSQHMRDADAA